MIQLLGLRPRGKKLAHAFFEEGWQAPSVGELLREPTKYVEQIPENERVNMFFTVHECEGVAPRDFTCQWYMPFDVDGVPESLAVDVAKVVCEAIGVQYEKTGVLYSGHGIQLFIHLEVPIRDEKYFEQNRKLYKLLIDEAQLALNRAQLPGKVDPAVFSAKRLMRMPETMNVKPEKEKKMAKVLQGHTEQQGWALDTSIKAPGSSKTGAISKKAFAKFPPPDADGAQEGCDFLKWTKDHPTKVQEPQWYAMVNLLSHLPGGRDLVHEYSKGHPDYTREETDLKIDQALAASGPRTCENIDTLWEGCKGCKYFQSSEIKTPVSIKGASYIGTEGTGFHYVLINNKGDEKKIPAYADMCKYWIKKNGPTFCAGKNLVFSYSKSKKVWGEVEPQELNSFFYNNYKPEVPASVVEETRKRLEFREAKKISWFGQNSGLVNLQNGVFDMKTGDLMTHKPDYGFRNILDFSYDEAADCPRFKKFLEEIMCGDEQLQQIIMEFIGYALSGDPCWIHKALIFLGTGSNGKSTLNKVIKRLIGMENCSFIIMRQLEKPEVRYHLERSMCNIADETNPKSLHESEMFKMLVAGGDVDVKKLYSQPYFITNRAKFIFNCNSMPQSDDATEALHRRMLFIPFDAHFVEGVNEKKDIEHELYAELPGIFNLAVEGYRRLKKNQRFSISEKSDELLEDFKEGQNIKEQWAIERIVEGDKEDFLTSDQMIRDFTDWCEDNKIRSKVSKQSFTRELVPIFGKKSDRKTINKKKYRGFYGVKFAERTAEF